MATNNSRRLLRRVENIRRYEWDPIGIADEPDAQDEYDSYAPQILSLVLAGETERRIAEALLTIETEAMGLRPNPSRALAVARSLKVER